MEALTPRQRAVVRRIAIGDSNADAAKALGVSINTIKKHLKLAFDALDVINRTELAVRVTHDCVADLAAQARPGFCIEPR